MRMRLVDPCYKGARFYKCDLHMHTPADATHWRGPRMGTADADRRAAAEAYIRQCYETGREVIAIGSQFRLEGVHPSFT